MSTKFTRLSALVFLAFVTAVGMACSIQIDPFETSSMPATLPAGAPTGTPVIATVTPAGLPTLTATPTAAAVASPAIRKFKMLDANNGWAVSDANVLRTTDGGATWLNVTPAGLGEVGYVACFFADASQAWIVIPASDFTTGTLYRTQDAGASWTAISVPFAGGDLKFIDPANGFVLTGLSAGAGSEAVAVFQTGDGGATWVRNYINDPSVSGAADSLPLGGQKSGMTFRDTTHGWVSGQTPVENYVYFYVSSDSGHTWAQQNVVLPPAEQVMMGADAPVFFDQNTGVLPVAIVAESNSRVFFVTQDGGGIWRPTSFVPGLGQYALISAREAVVWDGGPLLYATHDGMLNWSEVRPNISLVENMAQIQFIDANTGWVLAMDANSHSSLYKTTDGGATWAAILP